MSDALELHLNIQKSLEKDLEESNKHLLKINKSTDKLVDNYDDINKKIKGQNTLLKDVAETTSKLTKTFISGFGLLNIADIVRDTFAVDNNLKKLSARTSENLKNFELLKSTTYDMAFQTGVAADKISDLMTELKHFKVADSDLTKLSKSVIYFNEATGVSINEVSQLVGNMTKYGKMTTEQTNVVLVHMAKAQRAFNMTEGELSAMADTIQLNTKRMQQMGKTNVEIANMQKGVAKLSGAFAQVGIEASRTSGIINDLLDPSKIEDNALMYAKLGVSISDVINGSVDVVDLAPKFKVLGQEIKNGGMAGVALAKQLGLTVEEARQLADIDMTKFEKAMRETGGDASKALEAMRNESLGVGDKIAKNWERIKTQLMGLIEKLLPIVDAFTDQFTKLLTTYIPKIKEFFDETRINKLANSLINFVSTGVKKIPTLLFGALIAGMVVFPKLLSRKANYTAMTDEIKDAFSVGIREGIMMGVEKSELKSMLLAQRSGQVDDKTRRIQMSSGYKRRQEAADTLESVAQTNLFKATEKMVKNTAEWNRELAKASIPVSRLVTLAEKWNKDAADATAKSLSSAQLQQNILEQQNSSLINRKQELEGFIKAEKEALESRGKTSSLTLEKMERIYNNLEKRITETNVNLSSVQDSIANRTEKYYENLSRKDRGIAIQKLQDLEAERKTRDSILASRLEEINIENDLLKLEEMATSNRLEELNRKKEGNTLTVEEAKQYIDLVKRRKEINGMQADLTEETKRTNEELFKSTESAKQIAKELEIAKKGLIDANIPDEIKSIPRKLRDGIFAFGKGIKASVDSFGAKVIDSARAFREVTKSTLDPKNIAIAARGAAGGVLKMAMSGLGIGTLISVFMKNEKVQQAIAKVMEKLQPIIDRVAGAMGEIIVALMPLVDILLPPLLKLLGGVIKVINFFLKAINEVVKVFTKKTGPLDKIVTELDSVANALIENNFTTEENTKANKSLEKNISSSNDKDAPTVYGAFKGGELKRIPNYKAKEVSSNTEKEQLGILERIAKATEVSAGADIDSLKKESSNSRVSQGRTNYIPNSMNYAGGPV